MRTHLLIVGHMKGIQSSSREYQRVSHEDLRVEPVVFGQKVNSSLGDSDISRPHVKHTDAEQSVIEHTSLVCNTIVCHNHSI